MIMLSRWLKKFVGAKISLLVTASLVFVVAVALVVISQFSPQFLTSQNFITLTLLFAVFFIFFQIALVVLAIGIFITKPLQKVIFSMKRVGEGSLMEKCDLKSSDEFGELSECFNKMISSSHQINDSRQQIEKKLLIAEEGLKYKRELEEKAKIIERMNVELSGAFSDISLLYTVSQYLSSVLEVDELVFKVKKIFEEKFKCNSFALYFIVHDSNKIKLAAQKGLCDDIKETEQLFDLHKGIAGKTIKYNRSFYINDLEVLKNRTLLSPERHFKGAILSIPLRVRGTVIGVLTVCRHQINSFPSTDRQSLESMANQIAVVFDRAQLHTKTKELSVRDELTGAYNRRHFYQVFRRELKRAKRFQRPVSLLMIDMDHFKQFNDSHGHIKGDALLKEFVLLLKRNIREIDVLARFGGEEFVLLLADTRMSDAITVANKLRELVKTYNWGEALTVVGDGHTSIDPITISIGVSAYPECGFTQGELIKKADVALYKAKKDGRDLVRTFQMCEVYLEEMKKSDTQFNQVLPSA